MRNVIIIGLVLLGLNLYAKESTESILAKTLYLEAANQSTAGKELVATVIWNRADGNISKISSVCLAKKQFSCWNKRKPANVKIKASKEYAVCQAIAHDVVTGKFLLVYDINAYHEKRVHPSWGKAKWFEFQIQDHLFYHIPDGKLP